MARMTHMHPKLSPMRLVSRRTQEYAGPCPLCGGGAQSDRFHVWLNSDNPRYWCRACDQKGTLAELLDGDPRPVQSAAPRGRAVRHTAPAPTPAHIPFYRQLYLVVAFWAAQNLWQDYNPEPLAYIQGRGFTKQQIRHALLGVTYRDPTALVHHIETNYADLLPFAEEAGVLVRLEDGTLRTHWSLCGSLTLPYSANDEIVDLRTRTYPGKGYKSLSGGYTERGAVFPFGWDSIGDATTLILTEGEFKALAVTQAYQHGQLPMPALAHPGLTYLREEWPAMLRARGITTVILAYDSQCRTVKDSKLQLTPEEIWTIRHGQQFVAAGIQVQVLRLPLAPGQTKADLDEYLQTHGAGALNRLLDAAPDLQDYHRSLPCSLLRQAKLPLPNSIAPRGRPRRLPAAPAAPRPAATITLEEARDAIPELIQRHAQTGTGMLVLKHPQGCGKGFGTTLGLQQAKREAEAFGQIVWSGVRKEQIHDQHGLELIPLHGRNEGNCRKLAEAQTLTAKGYSALHALCERRCPHLPYCTYLKQFSQEADFFATQPLLQATRWWSDADIVVLDEFDPAQLTRMVALQVGDLVAMSRGTDCPHAQAMLRWLCSLIGTNPDCQLGGALLLQALAQTAQAEGAHLYTTLHAALAALPSEEDQARLSGFPQQATLSDYETLPPGYLPTLLNQIDAEERRRLTGDRYTSRLELRGGQLHLYLRQERLIAQLANPAQPKAILDASANLTLLRAIFPTTPIQIEQPQIPIPAHVTQVISRDWAKSTIIGEHKQERRQRWIEAVATTVRSQQPTLVVCTLACEHDLREGLAAHGLTNVTVAHYGALRGSNAYKGHDVVLAQVYHPNLEAIIREGRALFADDATPLDERVVIQERMLQDASNQSWAVDVHTFADPRLAALLETRREEEMTQAALRGRPFDHPDVTITLLFGLPLPNLPPTIIVDTPPTPASNSGRQEAARTQLLDAARQLLDAGQHALTVAALAKAAGVSVTTVRAHWQAIAHELKLRPTLRRTRRAMPKGGTRWYVAEVLIRRGRKVPPSIPLSCKSVIAPPVAAMIDRAADHESIPPLIHHQNPPANPSTRYRVIRSRVRKYFRHRSRRWRTVRRE